MQHSIDDVAGESARIKIVKKLVNGINLERKTVKVHSFTFSLAVFF
jgi:hypothetical protein